MAYVISSCIAIVSDYFLKDINLNLEVVSIFDILF